MQKVAAREPTPWQHYVISWAAGVYLWCALTPLILWLGRRFPLGRRHWARVTAIHLAASIGISIAQPATEAALLRLLHVFPTIMVSYPATLAFLLIIGFHQGVLTYWTILGVQYAAGWYSRYQERKQQALNLEAQLVSAHLSALKMQLQPHFLFNTLNAIMVLVRQQKGRQAEEMLARLSDLLRCVLDDVEAQEVPLRRELEYLELYLSIEQVRFQDRLRVDIAASPEVLDAAVPHMVLQPIVENAIRHGIGRSSSAGHLRISAARGQDALELEVSDDGPGLQTAFPATASRGIGLANTRSRLAQLYGDAARLSVDNGAEGGVTARIVLPFRPMPEEADVLHGAAD